MDGSSGRARPAARDVTPPGTRRGRRRRRPTGEPPPLPHHLESTGVGWMVAAVGLIALTLLTFTVGRYGRGIAFSVVADSLEQRLAAVRTPGLTSLMRGVSGLLASIWTAKVLAWWTLIVLVVYKRYRQLIVGLVSVELTALLAIALSAAVRRPRPFGVSIEASWTAWSMPSRPVALLAAVGVAMLYSLVPKGRWRQTGKWVVTALVALLAFAQLYLGAATLGDVLVGAALGVTIPLLAFRWFAPNDVFPVSYHRGRTAHLDVGGARGQAIRRALSDQLGLEIEDVKPFGLAGSAGSTPLRIKVAGDPPTVLFGKLYARSHLRSDRWYKLGRELLYGRLEDEKPFHTRAPAGPAGGLCPAQAPPGRAAHAPPLRVRRADPRPRVPAGVGVLRRRRRARRGRGRPGRDRRRPRDHPQALGRRAGPPRHQAGQPAGPRRPHDADRRGLRRVAAHAMARGRRPGQHDAVPGPAQRLQAGLRAGPAPVLGRGHHRSVRGHPRPGHALPAAAHAAGPGPRPARRVPRPAARAAGPHLHPALDDAPHRAGPGRPVRTADRRAHAGRLGGTDRPGQRLPVHQRRRLLRPGGAVVDGPGGADGHPGALRPGHPARLDPERRQGGQRVRQHRLQHRPADAAGGRDGGAAAVLRPGRRDRGQLRGAGGQALHPHRPRRHPRPGHPHLHLPGRLRHRAVRLARQPGAHGRRRVVLVRLRHPRPAGRRAQPPLRRPPAPGPVLTEETPMGSHEDTVRTLEAELALVEQAFRG